ncbi:MAG: hypothetical protein CSA26_05230 [Desulfobacterales bacterium]|nr:MAG: hypothetical protein CSA26_05230 [Desulfobacterales bacterium]
MCHMLEAMVRQHGYQTDSAKNGLEGLERVRKNRYDFILCDLKMPRMDGMAFLSEAGSYLTDTTVIVMSAYGTVDTALEAMKAGAYDFISKPFKRDEVLLALKKAEEREALRKENRLLKEKIEAISRTISFDRMIGESRVMQEVFALSRKVAEHDVTVLITGESGTGKELIAKGIHRYSARQNRGFIAVNCGSIPRDLLESELFGALKGAFTGADRNRSGLFEEADGGTLFLDEIGELPLDMQVKLLRVLQEKEIRPVGGSRSRRVDVRIVAATSRDLEEMVRQGGFRQDLFYRLNVVRIQLPPLRERGEDIPLLVNHFLAEMNRTCQQQVNRISRKGLKMLHRYQWPGNVRELENVLQHCAVMAEGDCIEAGDLPDRVRQEKEQDLLGTALAPEVLSLKQARKLLERQLIEKALSRSNGNKSKAALLLEISYPSLLARIKEFDLD